MTVVRPDLSRVLGEVEAAGVQAHAVAMRDSSPGRVLAGDVGAGTFLRS